MIDEVLLLLKDATNDHLGACLGWAGTPPDQGQVVFPDTDKTDAAEFKLGAITQMLINLEQEHAQRPPDPYRQVMSDGTTQRVAPPLHLNAYVLFVARLKDYQQSLRYLSLIMKFFQSHRYFNHETSPQLSDKIEKLCVDLMTLPMQEVYNLWSLLRSSYQPSLLYRVRMIVYHDENGLTAPAGTAPTLRFNT